eukprot:jgi/Bigna1/80064/fgenesh1_pg.67_\
MSHVKIAYELLFSCDFFGRRSSWFQIDVQKIPFLPFAMESTPQPSPTSLATASSSSEPSRVEISQAKSSAKIMSNHQKLRNQLSSLSERYKQMEREQAHLLNMAFRKMRSKLATSHRDQTQENDLLDAVKMEIQFRRQLKAQTLSVIERILAQGCEDIDILKAEHKKLSTWKQAIQKELKKAHQLQESNVTIMPKELDVYDLVIDIDQLSDLASNGWKIESAADFQMEQTEDGDQWNGAIIAVVGLYDKGKTFLLNQISGAKLPSGRKVRTKGLSFKHMEVDKMKFCLLDSAGSNAPVRVENNLSVYQKHVTELFILDVVFEVSDYFICVVNDFTSLDQRYLDKIARFLQKSKKDFREVIVVHNFKGITSAKALDYAWKSQVTQVYHASGGSSRRTRVAATNPCSRQLEDKTVTWYKTRYSRHICLANATSQLGLAINPWAVSLLRYWLKSVVVPTSRKRSIQDTIVTTCTKKLSMCFKARNSQLKVFETEEKCVSYIRPTDPEHRKRFISPRMALYGHSVVLECADSFKPDVDIIKTRNEFIVYLDAPGISPDSISLSRKGQMTTISGKRNNPTKIDQGEECANEKRERRFGDFSVSVDVPSAYMKRWKSCTVENGALRMIFSADLDDDKGVALVS